MSATTAATPSVSSSTPTGVRVGRGGMRGGRGGLRGSGRLTADSIARHDAAQQEDSDDKHTAASNSAAAGASSSSSSSTLPPHQPRRAQLKREESLSNASDASSASHIPHPECLLCCLPIASYTIATCQHSGQICGTCVIRWKKFIKKKEEPLSASAPSPLPPPADLLNEDNDFKPSAASAAPSSSSSSSAVVPVAAEEHMKCPYCHQDWTRVLITREYDIRSNDPRTQPPPTSSFGLSTDARYNSSSWIYDSKWNVYFENELIKSKFFMMTGYYCVLCYNLHDAFTKSAPPQKRYDKVHMFLDQQQLEKHLEEKHQRFLCTACFTTRKIFIHEHEIFTRKELTNHFKFGSNPATIKNEYRPANHDMSGTIEPHSFCQFCEKPYFSSDELYAHLITIHRSCRFCQSEGFMRYFRTDNALRTHFREKHYLCEEGKCRREEANRAGFRDVLALKAHKLAAHTEGLSKEEIKKMQQIDLNNLFTRDSFRNQRQNHPSSSSSSRRELDEFEFRIDDPPTLNSGAVSGFDFEESVEDFPTLNGRPVDSSIPRSASQPSFRGPPASLRSEEQFPSLGGVNPVDRAFPPLGSSSSQAPTAYRGAPPTRDDFPTLRSVVKSEAKLAKKQEEKRQKASSSSSSSNTVDNRTVASVPLPLPPAIPASELPSRNKALVAGVRSALRNDADAFEAFKQSSQAYRTSEMTPAAYLDEFYRLCANNPAGERETEVLLIDLIATLSDDAQRVALHGEYAKRKIMNHASQKLKSSNGDMNGKEKKANKPKASTEDASPSIASKLFGNGGSSTSPSPLAAVAPSRSLSASPSLATTVASSSSSSSSLSSSSSSSSYAAPIPTAAVTSFTTVASKKSGGKLKLVSSSTPAQGISSFEGKQVKQLKKDTDEPKDFLSIIAKEKEAAEKEKHEKDAVQEREAKKAEASSSWGGASSASSLLAPTPQSRGPPGFSNTKPSAKVNNNWSVLADENDDVDPNPPLPSSSPAATTSSDVALPEADYLDKHLATIESLRILPAPKSKLQLLAMLFHELQHIIVSKYGPINSTSNQRYHLSPENRTVLQSLLRQTRFQHVHEWTRIARIGLMPNSISLLNGLVGMHARYGGDMVGNMLAESLVGMSPTELFLLVEWIHGVLLQLTKPTHPDMKEMNAVFEKDAAKRAEQNARFGGVPIAASANGSTTATSVTREDLFERSSGNASTVDESQGGGGKSKKSKKGTRIFL